MLSHLLQADPASPRITVYNEVAGSRMDFSAQTLDNWVSKIANMLGEELELEPDNEETAILLDLPVSWQAVVIALGALAARVRYVFATDLAATNADDADAPNTASAANAADAIGAAGAAVEPGDIAAVFTSPDKFDDYDSGRSPVPAGADIVLVSDDPFGRGIVESGGQLPTGAIDFGPTVRFYGDQFFGPTPALPEVVGALPADAAAPQRWLSTGWTGKDSFVDAVLRPLATGGSAVIVAGMTDTARLEEIAVNERVTARL